MTEHVTIFHGDIECAPDCRNDPTLAGFVVAMPDGTITHPHDAGPWDGIHLVCAACGRIINQDTGEVTGRRDPAGVIEAEQAAMDADNARADR